MGWNMRTLRQTLTIGVAFFASLVCISHSEDLTTRPTLTRLYSFNGGPSDGANPAAALSVAGGVLVGTTTSGGVGCVPVGCGTVFSLTPPTSPGGSWTEAVLYSFTGISGDGANPYGGIVSGAGGALYGTTAYGGCAGCGTVFSLTPPESPNRPWVETVLHSFTGSPNDGSGPSAGVVIGGGGVLYGTTEYDGALNAGTVYSLTPPASPGSTWTESVLHNFTGVPGD
jgi:uncharacterized repeat protein (TIGR03803 family)